MLIFLSISGVNNLFLITVKKFRVLQVKEKNHTVQYFIKTYNSKSLMSDTTSFCHFCYLLLNLFQQPKALLEAWDVNAVTIGMCHF
jgi:hypothetical protein